MTAILKYTGGKWRIADWIISHFPKHNVYLEPFFGSGAVFFKKQPARIETINDINGEIVNLFKVIRNNPAELAKAIEFTPWAREEFVDCHAPTPDNPVEWARRVIVRYHQSFGSNNRCKNSWKTGQRPNAPHVCGQWSRIPESILSCAARLKQAQIECTDGIELIKAHNHPDVLIYADPPYMLQTRAGNLYKNEMPDNKHLELLSALKESKAKIVLSGYDNELYNQELSGWYTAETATINIQGNRRTEKIWCNFNPPMTALITGLHG